MPASETIRISVPTAGTVQQIPSAAGVQVEFGFDQSKALFERAGVDLTVKVEGRGEVVLQNFFAVGDQALPTFVLPDGTQVAAADLLHSIDPNFDISTADGPAASSAPSGGGTSYNDATGDLLGGVDRLGSLGADQWDGGRDRFTAQVSDGGDAGDFTPATPVPPVDPDFPKNILAQARAVAYLNKEGDDASAGEYSYSFRPAFAVPLSGGNLAPASSAPAADPVLAACSAGEGDFFTTAWVNGELVITLTAAGKQWMLDNAGEDLVGYFRIQDPGDAGKTYVLQAVFAASEDFDSSTTPWNAYYDSSASVFGETHQGVNPNESTGYDVTTTNKNDILRFSGDMENASLDARAGNDTLSVSGVVKNSDINMGPGTDTALIDGQLLVDNGTHTVTMDKGSFTVNAKGDAQSGGFVTGAGVKLTVDGNEADIAFNADRSVGFGPTAPAMGLSVTEKAEANIGGRNVSATAQAASVGYASGVYLRNEASVTLDVAEKFIASASTQEGQARGLDMRGNTRLDMEVGGDAVIAGDAAGGWAFGAQIIGGEANMRVGGDLTISADTRKGAGVAYGLNVSNSANLTAEADGAVNIAARAFGGSSFGLYASGGTADMRAASLAVEAEGRDVLGVFSQFASSNINAETTGDIDISLAATGTATGLQAYQGAIDLVGKNIRVDVDAEGDAKGVLIERADGGSVTLESAKTLSLDVTSASGAAHGIHNERNANVTLRSGESMEIKATAESAAAYGMYAAAKGVNRIEGSEDGLKLDITAQGKTASYAMLAESNGKNIIEGKGGNDTVTITGDVYGWRSGENYGNSISTGAGDDSVQINGAATGLLANLGAGDDTLAVTGVVSNSRVIAGEGSDSVTVNGRVVSGSVISLGNNISGADSLNDGGNSLAIANSDASTALSALDHSTVYGAADKDVISINSAAGYGLTAGYVYTGDGDDVVNIASGNTAMRQNSAVVLGNGNQTVNVAAVTGRGLENSTINGAGTTGDKDITVTGGTAGAAVMIGSILTGSGDDIIRIYGNAPISWYSADSWTATGATINGGTGSDTILVNVYEDGTKNTNTTQGISGTIVLDADDIGDKVAIYANGQGASATIRMGGGTDTLSIESRDGVGLYGTVFLGGGTDEMTVLSANGIAVANSVICAGKAGAGSYLEAAAADAEGDRYIFDGLQYAFRSTQLYAGSGNDLIEIKSGWLDTSGLIHLGGGNDTLKLSSAGQGTNGLHIDGRGDAIGDVYEINAAGGGLYGSGLYAGNGDDSIVINSSSNAAVAGGSTIDAGGGDNTISLTGQTGLAGGSTLNIGTGDDVVTITASKFQGLLESRLNSTGGNDTISIQGNGYAGAQLSTLTFTGAGRTELNISATGSGSPAMLASRIDASGADGGITVNLEGTYAMRSDYRASSGLDSNYLIGGSKLGDEFGDVFTIKGDLAQGQYSSSEFIQNIISTGHGNDTVDITGNLSGARVAATAANAASVASGDTLYCNVITMNEGDDDTRISGNVAGTVIGLGTSIDGADTLGVNDENRLSIGGSLTNSAVYGDAGHDHVTVSGKISGSVIDLGAGNDCLSIGDTLGAGSQIHGGSGYDTLNLDAFSAKFAGGEFSLGDLGGMVRGFEHIDLTGDHASVLNVNLGDLFAWNDDMDGLLGGLSHSSGADLSSELTAGRYITIAGNSADTVKLDSGISDAGSMVSDGMHSYNVYSYNEGGNTHYLLIQQDIIVA